MPKEPDQPKNSQNHGWGYKLACVLLLLSIVLYATSLTMNVARVEGRVKINNDGVTEMVDGVVSNIAKKLDLSKLINTQLRDELPLDQVSDEITGLIREYVWKLKKQASSEGALAAAAADQIDLGNISRTMNKEVKARAANLLESAIPEEGIELSNLKLPDLEVPDMKVPDPEPEVREIKLLATIRDLYQGTKTSKPDAFLATCILLFTIFFPISKFLALGWILLPASRNKVQVLDWLKTWGQWSMGDVFVIAFMVTFMKLNTSVVSASKLADIYVHVDVLNGMYVFGTAIILSMIASMLVTHHVRESAPTPENA